jgi:hypothetical protein
MSAFAFMAHLFVSVPYYVFNPNFAFEMSRGHALALALAHATRSLRFQVRTQT